MQAAIKIILWNQEIIRYLRNMGIKHVLLTTSFHANKTKNRIIQPIQMWKSITDFLAIDEGTPTCIHNGFNCK